MSECFVWSISLASTEEKERTRNNALLENKIQKKNKTQLLLYQSNKREGGKRKEPEEIKQIKQKEKHQMQYVKIIMLLDLYKNIYELSSSETVQHEEKKKIYCSRESFTRGSC